MRVWRKIRWLVALAGLVAVGSAGSVALHQLRKPQRGIPTARVRRGPLDMKVHTTGVLRASKTATLVAPSVGGSMRIVSLAKTGVRVHAGDMVVEFDPSEQQYNLDENRYDLGEAEQEIAKAKADAAVQAAKDQVDLLKAKFDVQRAELEVSRNELVSVIDAKKNLLGLEEAKRRLAQFEQDIQSHTVSNQASLEVAEEKRHKAKLAMQQADQNIQNMHVTSPIEGLVALKENRNASGGMYYTGMRLPEYREGDEVGPGEMVAEVLDVEQMEIQCRVEESDRTNLNSGQPVDVQVDALPDRIFRGKVKTVAGLASRGGWWSGSATSKFDVALGLDKADPELRSGLTVQAVIESGQTKDALYVPRQALFEKDGKPVVYVKNGAGFEARQVKITSHTESQVAVEDLAEGTEVALVNPEEQAGKTGKTASPVTQPSVAVSGGGR